MDLILVRKIAVRAIIASAFIVITCLLLSLIPTFVAPVMNRTQVEASMENMKGQQSTVQAIQSHGFSQRTGDILNIITGAGQLVAFVIGVSWFIFDTKKNFNKEN